MGFAVVEEVAADCPILSRSAPNANFAIMEFKISVREITCGRQDTQSFAIARSLGLSIDNIRLMDTEDKLVWNEDGKAIFKAGEIVKKCRTQGVKEWWRKKIWFSYAPAKSFWHTYIACAGRLPTLDRLQKVGIHLANRCPLCLSAEETNGHVLIKCRVAKEVWWALETAVLENLLLGCLLEPVATKEQMPP
ncbi:hypothetical protein EJ110_NYTH15469 [Nymphaea thermarum]|nr:hypothetical protein EJ110_NYTH15469 [Nymphaea thermarum]